MSSCAWIIGQPKPLPFLIILPKVNAVAKPVIIIGTGYKIVFTVYNLINDRTVTSVKADDKVRTL